METERSARYDAAVGVAPHPEAMFATVVLKVGNVSLIASARTTPASVICAGLVAVGILVGVSAIIRARRV